MQRVLFNEPKKLPYLVGLRLTPFGLKVEQLRHIGVDEEVMAASYSVQPEPETFYKVYHVLKGDVMQCSRGQPLKKAPAFHGPTLTAALYLELASALNASTYCQAP